MNKIDVVYCCAECGEEGGASLKACKSCMIVKYCNANCQRNHWPKHKKVCKLRAAKIRDEALFKDPPAKEDCPICFLPMPVKLICCVSLPPATLSSVPICDFAMANEELASMGTTEYYSCCGKYICGGCMHSFHESGNSGKCPFCKADLRGKTDGERVEEFMKRVEVNDAASMMVLGTHYYHGQLGLLQERDKAEELWTQAAKLGSSQAHYELGISYHEGGDLKKKKFHYEAAAMAGNEVARFNLGFMEYLFGNMERAVKHWTIAASAGHYRAMGTIRDAFENAYVSREAMNSTLAAYNNSCVEMRSEARDAAIRMHMADN